jgi:ankyrin repeat protein
VKAVVDSSIFDVNAVFGDKLTALMLSLDCDTDGIALCLLSRPDLDIHATSSNGWNALFYAAEFRHKLICQKLIDMRIDLNHKDNENWTALMVASRSNTIEVVKYITKNASLNLINAKQSDGWSALAIAVAMDFKDIVIEHLCGCGSDVNSRQDHLAIFSELKNSLHKRIS